MELPKDSWGSDCGKTWNANFRFNLRGHWELLKRF